MLDDLKRPVWIFDFDDFRILDANEAAARLWGRADRAELLAESFVEVSPAVRDRLNGYRARLEAGEAVEEDWTFHPPGGPVSLRCLCSGIRLADGRLALLAEATRTGTPASEGVTRALEAMRHAGAAIVMLDEERGVIVANPMAEMLLGLHVGADTRPDSLFADPKRGSEALAWASGGAIFDDEAVLRTAMGERWFAVRIHPAIDPATGRPAIVVSASDVHRRRMVEQRLSESEQARTQSERHARDLAAAQRRAAEAERILRDAIESLDQGFLLVGRDDRILMANRRYLELYPPLADHLIPGTDFADTVRAFAAIEDVAIDGSTDKWVEWRIAQMRQRTAASWEQYLRDGRTFLVDERQTASGNVVSLRTDITYLKRIETELRERVQALETASDGIAITDRDGLFVYMNTAHAEMFGGQPADFLGTSWRDLYDPQAAQRFEREVFPRVRIAGSWRGEAVARRRDGRPVEQELSLSRTEGGGLLCVTREIGARKAAEAERARLQRQLFQTQKMESLGRLAGGIAHDFNNILASMLGYASFLVEDLPDGSEQHRYASSVVGAGKRAQDLVAQILAFGRSGERKTTVVALRDVVAETVELLHGTLPEAVELATELAGADEMPVLGDRTQLTQIVMNLAVNARDAIGEGPGRIVFSLRRGAAPDWPAVAQTKDGPAVQTEQDADGVNRLWLNRPPADGDFVEIRVADTGPGIPAEVMQSMFEPFFTTKRRGQGTGLGLAAVHGLVTSHGGAIAVESRPGAGASFAVLLPRAAAPAAAAEPPAGSEDGVQRRILVVDDEEGVRSMLATALARRGYAATVAANAAEALAAIERSLPDAVISDQHMPKTTGLELMARIHERHPGLPVVLCTGFSDRLDATTAEAAGAAAFVNKPVAADDLLAVLERVLQAAKPQRQAERDKPAKA